MKVMNKYQYKVQGVDYEVVVTILDADDAVAAYFEFYAAPGTTSLVGSYTCIEYAENNPDGWVVSNGWSFPDWGIAGGSHYVTGGKQTDLAVGDVVIVLEAMKMQNNIEAEYAGTITSITVNQGDSVMEGAVLLTIG